MSALLRAVDWRSHVGLKDGTECIAGKNSSKSHAVGQ